MAEDAATRVADLIFGTAVRSGRAYSVPTEADGEVDTSTPLSGNPLSPAEIGSVHTERA
jgi:hypothetical protein